MVRVADFGMGFSVFAPENRVRKTGTDFLMSSRQLTLYQTGRHPH
jgi:hypothetical protein